MATNYDKLYSETRHVLGAPTQVFVDFFETHAPSAADVLDVGCGQGRDALFIARLGHRVTAVDMSPAGIANLQKDAAAENLDITGVVSDIRVYEPEGQFDIVLIDRTLHMLGEADRLQALERLIPHVRPDGQLLIADEKSNIGGFEDVLEKSRRKWAYTFKRGGYLFARPVT